MPRKKKRRNVSIEEPVFKKLSVERGTQNWTPFLAKLLRHYLKEPAIEEADASAKETAIKELDYPRCSKCQYSKDCMRSQHGEEGVIFSPCKDFRLAFPRFPDYCEYQLRLWTEGKVRCLNPKPHVRIPKNGIISDPQVCWTCMKVGKKKRWGIPDRQYRCFNCNSYMNCKHKPYNKQPLPLDPVCENFKLSPHRKDWRPTQ